MALFGFGKKKKDNEVGKVQEKPDEPAVRVQKAKVASSSVRRFNSKKSSIKRPGTVKRPSVAVKPSQPDSSRTVVAKAMEEATHSSQRKIRTSTRNKQVGQLLLSANKITKENLDKALSRQKEKGGLLGQILVGFGYCTKADVASVLKKQRTITTVNLNTTIFDREALNLMSREFCEKNKLIPFELVGTQLFLAMSNALDTLAKNEVKEKTQMHIKIFDSSNDDINKAIAKNYSADAETATGESSPTLAEAAKQEESELTDLVIEIPDEGPDIAEEEIDIIDIDDDDQVIDINHDSIVDEAGVKEPSIYDTVDNVKVVALEETDPELLEEVTAKQENEEFMSCHAGNIPSVGDLSFGDTGSHFTVLEGGMQAIPISESLADSIVHGSKVDLVKLWVEERSGKVPVPAALPIG